MLSKINKLEQYKSYIYMGLSIFFSRITGLIKELFIAYTLGVSGTADSVNLAFKLPTLFRRILGEGALAPVLTPLYRKKLLAKDKSKNADYLASNIGTILLLMTILIVIILISTMPYIIHIIAPGFKDSQQLTKTIILCRISLIYLIFITGIAIIGTILQTIEDYLTFAISPCIFNIMFIISSILFTKILSDEYSIIIAMLISGMLQLIFLYLCSYLRKIKLYIIKPIINEDTKRFFQKLLPSILSSSILQINLFVSQALASFFPGAISILSYADRIYQLPLSLIGVTLSTVLLTSLSKIYKENNKEIFFQKQNTSILIGIFFSLPATFGIMALSQEIIFVLYKRGEFTMNDVTNTGNVLYIYSLSIPAIILSRIMMQVFYSSGNTKIPMKITFYSVLINISLSIILKIYFGFLGICSATSISAWISLIIQILYLKKQKLLSINYNIYFNIIKSIIFSIVMYYSIILIKNYTRFNISITHNQLNNIYNLLIIILLGILIYIAPYIYLTSKKKHNL